MHTILTCVKNYIGFLIVMTLVCCGQQGKRDQSAQTSLFTRLDSAETRISFANRVTDRENFNVMTYRNYYNGGGVAIGDVNGDGLADIYMTANMAKNKLYLNKGNWKFEDITEASGVGGSRAWSTGVTMADINNDGLLDIYVCNSGDVKGDNKENELFINNGDLTFTERAAEFGLNNTAYSTHASFFDYDLDGDLDCYLLNNSFKNVERVDQFTASRYERVEDGDKLFRNDNGHFTDVTEAAGIFSAWVGFGLGVSVSDINGDMYPDIYISNDFWERDYLYVNQGNGTFSEELISRTCAISGSSMGADVADLDNDGYEEIFTTEMLPADNLRIKTLTRFEETNVKELKVRSSYHYQLLQNCLHFNDGQGNFQELAFFSNVAATDWSWGALMFDMDNDGWKDIFVANGIYRDITSMDFVDFVDDRENIKKIVLETGKFDFNDLLNLIPSKPVSNYAFINQRNRTFTNMADSLGLAEPSFSNGSAYGDLDNDGDLDLVVNNVNMPSFIYRNNANTVKGNNFLRVKFKGSPVNTFGIGAKVSIYAGGKQQVFQNYTTRSFESSVEPKLHFGTGRTTSLDSLVVIWPDHKTQVLRDVKVNQELVLDYAKADKTFNEQKSKAVPLYSDVTSEVLKGDYTHRENDFNDFDVERLLPRKLSTEGPKIVTGDLNGDGLEDFLLLGAFDEPDKIFLQDKNGQFNRRRQQNMELDANYESTCAAFSDLDNDGDLDIIIGSGGNELRRGPHIHLVRCYLNNGKGNFVRTPDLIPSSIGSFSTVLTEDFDQDGDVDLFLGGRMVPGNYGMIPRSFLFRNDGKGTWTEITPKTLGGAGMITDALWSDVSGDGKKDLIVVGEWMPVKIYGNKGKYIEEAQALSGTEGWWTTIERADFNGDGLDDYVLGNWGLNTKFKATPEKPLKMYVKDFDQNNKSEFIINWYAPSDDMAYPFASKSDMTGQLPHLKKNGIKYEAYAQKTYEQLFTEEQRKGALELRATILQSALLLNQGNYQFRLDPLPLEAQVSPVFSMLAEDLDGDDNADILAGGNFYGLKPEVGRHDSNFGVFLKGDGQGNFTPISYDKTGLYFRGEVRDIKAINIRGGDKAILVGRNDAPTVLFKKQTSSVVVP